MTTPTDSAMTAGDVRDILERLDYASKSKTFGSDDEASMVRVAHRVIRALTADLARVEGERDALRVEKRQLMQDLARFTGDVADALVELVQKERAGRLAAEAKSARLEEALRSALAYVEQDEEAHGRKFGTGNAIRSALTLPEPSHEPTKGERA